MGFIVRFCSRFIQLALISAFTLGCSVHHPNSIRNSDSANTSIPRVDSFQGGLDQFKYIPRVVSKNDQRVIKLNSEFVHKILVQFSDGDQHIIILEDVVTSSVARQDTH